MYRSITGSKQIKVDKKNKKITTEEKKSDQLFLIFSVMSFVKSLLIEITLHVEAVCR